MIDKKMVQLMKKLLILSGMLYSLNNNPATAQIKDSAKKSEQSKIAQDSVINEKVHYAFELLDLEKEAGFNVRSSHYQNLDSLVNELGKYIHIGGVDANSKRTQVVNNLESIDLTLKKNNFIYDDNTDLLFYEALKTKNLNSFHFLVLYLEVASKKNFTIDPMKAGEHFFASYPLDSLNSVNWETTFGIEQSENLYKKLAKDNKKVKNLTKDEFLSREYRTIVFFLNKNKQFKKSIEYFNKVIEINPLDPLTYKYLGDSYGVLGDKNNSLGNYDLAIGLDPQFTQAYLCRGNIFCKKDKLEKALGDYNKAIELAPENPEFYKIRGDIHSLIYRKTEDILSEKRKPKQAQKDYEKALELIFSK